MYDKKIYYDIFKQKLRIDLYLNNDKPYIYGFFLNKKIGIYKNLLIGFCLNSICLQNE